MLLLSTYCTNTESNEGDTNLIIDNDGDDNGYEYIIVSPIVQIVGDESSYYMVTDAYMYENFGFVIGIIKVKYLGLEDRSFIEYDLKYKDILN